METMKSLGEVPSTDKEQTKEMLFRAAVRVIFEGFFILCTSPNKYNIKYIVPVE
jgi:hypothetical protein